MKVKIALLATLFLVFDLGTGVALASKPTEPCKVIGSVKKVADQNYVCSKVGKKRVWKKNVTPVEDLQATAVDSQFNFKWTSTVASDDILYIELGISLLNKSGLSLTSYSSYTRPQVFSRSTESLATITIGDLIGFLERQSLRPAGQAALVRVRVVSKDGSSTWSNGIYFPYESLKAGWRSPSNPASTPNPTPTATPTPNATPTATPTPSSSSKTFTITDFGMIYCPNNSSVVDGGLGLLPEAQWALDRRLPPDSQVPGVVYVKTATFSWDLRKAVRASGWQTIYWRDPQGDYLAPNGYRYRIHLSGPWEPPVWITCFASKYPLDP